jgi:outer membrane receptor protein involved in Fe transport
VTRANAYIIASDLRLYNDFTFFLRDPVNGDQFKQSDRRFVFGGALSREYRHTLFGSPAETTFGLQTRYDRIDVGLFNTAQRNILSVVRDDTVDEASTGLYAQNTLHGTPWLRTNLGLRGDVFYGNDRSNLAINSGSLTRGIASPKAGIVFGPFGDAEFYGNAGTGYHSNDVRGATIRIDPNDQVSALKRVPLLVRSKGAEIGSRVQIADMLQASAALFVLDFDSELVFSGDAGTTEASRPSRRIGGEINMLYRPLPWLVLDVDAAYSRARFTNSDPVGDHIPGAATSVVSAGAQFDKLGPYFGAIQLRYFGRRPLMEENTVTSKPTLLLSARAGYRLTESIELRLDIFNLLGSTAHQIDYFYASRLPGEPLEGVNDVHFKPVEPTAVRAGVAIKL